MVPLRRIHSDDVYARGLGRLSIEYWRRKPTVLIVASLAPAKLEALRVKVDGRILNGNTRIKVLEERGYNIESLPREVVE